MTTFEMLMVFFGAIGGGISVASTIYAIMHRMKKWKREMEPISPIPSTDGKICTSDRVGTMRGLMYSYVTLICLGFVLMFVAFAKSEIVLLLAGFFCSILSLLITVVWVLMRRKYGDSIRYTDTAFTVISLRVEPRRQTHPWNHIRGVTVIDDTRIRLDFKNGTSITLAYLNDTQDFIQTARAHISL